MRKVFMIKGISVHCNNIALHMTPRNSHVKWSTLTHRLHITYLMTFTKQRGFFHFFPQQIIIIIMKTYYVPVSIKKNAHNAHDLKDNVFKEEEEKTC